jgi:hypothetical protein
MKDAAFGLAANSADSLLPFEVAIVGLGINGVHQITKEVEEVIRRCRHVLVVDSGYGVLDFLGTLCPRVTNLAVLYKRGEDRTPTYHKMAAEVVSEAMSAPPVCFATYGHPRLYCYPTTLIKRAAFLLNLRVEVFCGVSSIDTMIIDLDFDIATDGLQIYEATDVLLRKRPLHNDVGCMLLQASTICDPTYPNTSVTPEQILPLQEYLQQFYPAEHPVASVMSPTFPLLRPLVHWFPLARLAVDLAISPMSGTLYIPPVASRPIDNPQLLNKMYSRVSTSDVRSRSKPPGRPGRPPIGPQPNR